MTRSKIWSPYGNVVDIKPIRDIVGPECIIIEDVAQSYDVMGDYLHLNTGKYSDFCILVLVDLNRQVVG